jgi:hypothetical protein
MVDIPNTSSSGLVLNSLGNGTNASVWGPSLNAQTVEVSNVTITSTLAAVSSLALTVSGKTNYLIMLTGTFQASTVSSSSAQLALYVNGTQLGNTISVAVPTASRPNQVVYQYVTTNIPITSTFQAYAAITGASGTITLNDGVLTVIGF